MSIKEIPLTEMVERFERKGPTGLKETILQLCEIGKNIRVLYVEDDSQIREEFLHFLNRFFSSVTVATNGKEGLSKALENTYDLIITDIMMPKLNGLEMIEKIKEKKPSQPTMIISAYHELLMLHRSIELGVDGYLFKPIKPQETIDLLWKAVSKIMMEKENLLYKNHLEKMIEIKNQELIQLYTIDHITGLYTLSKLEQDLTQSSKASLAFIKISDFKNLNDFYGYEVGNSILAQTANFLQGMVSDFDDAKLYRISGTHYALLISMDGNDLERFARYIIHMYESTEIQAENEMLLLEMDIGIVDYSEGLSLSKADIALREAQHKGSVVVYTQDDSKNKLRAEKLKCKDDIKRGLIEDRFVPFYQPIIDNKTKKIIKYEALARLITPDGKVISPEHFLSIAKETKTYAQVSQMVIRKAMEDFQNSECFISINLSIDDVKHPQTREFLFQQIEDFPQPNRLVFELLESEGIESYEDLGDFFNRIKHYGCQIAIDDFGSGYSNFERIAKLNIDYIKIDGSLVVNIGNSFLSQTIVEMVASFAKKIKIKTIAEFVTDSTIESKILSMGINESQGYLFGKAIPYQPSMRFIQSL